VNILLIGVIVLIVGIAVIGYAAKVAMEIIQGIADGADTIYSDIINWLGRRNLGHRASIPDILIDGPTFDRKKDRERDALESYDPRAELVYRPQPMTFKGKLSNVFGPFKQPSSVIYIDEFSDISNMVVEEKTNPLWHILNKEPIYSIQPPSNPPDPPAPPKWAPWYANIPAATFEPPLYDGRLTFLNRFVNAAYKGEMDRVARANIYKAEIEVVTKKRDAEMVQLADSAAKRWKKIKVEQRQSFDEAMSLYNSDVQIYMADFRAEQAKIHSKWELTQRLGADGLLARIDIALRTITLPNAVPREAESRFDNDSGVLIHEQRFPDLGELKYEKLVEQKSGFVHKAANQKECKEISSKLWQAISLRLACEIVRLDNENIIKAIAINGWAEYTDKSTGQRKRAYCSSLFATKDQITALNLAAVDPISAFNSLKGIAAHSLEVTPIAPIIRLDTNDPRFVDAKEILAHMSVGENLAAMDWEDFEHLCRELFERAFANNGAEVKVTQASRDQGVDAIIFDPDPLRGGKIIIQAKRYTNLVDVSAVRDLYGAVINEGAIKGILVTTSNYGPDSYSFAKDKPLTLLAGRELLGLLDQYGYKFRIDLAEAKRMMAK
jgi:restriction system protein